jgi:transcriptional regulator with XRE-family HTH domain
MIKGNILKIFRQLKDLSQQQLAEKLHTTLQYISELERMEHFNGIRLNEILVALKSNMVEWEQFKKLPPQ